MPPPPSRRPSNLLLPALLGGAILFLACGGGGICGALNQPQALAGAEPGLKYGSPETFQVGVRIPDQVPALTGFTAGGPPSFQVTAGALPKGLDLNQDGTISGVPQVDQPEGTDFTVTVQEGSGTSAQISSCAVHYAVVNRPPKLTYNPFTAGAGVKTHFFYASNQGGPVQDLTSSGSPQGITPDPVVLGQIDLDGTTHASSTGTPYRFSVVASNDGGSDTAGVQVTITPAPPPFGLAYATPLFFQELEAVTQLPTVTGATSAVTTFELSDGSLPSGLQLNRPGEPNGSITGNPDVPTYSTGGQTFEITAFDGGPASPRKATLSLHYMVYDPPPLLEFAPVTLFPDAQLTLVPVQLSGSGPVQGIYLAPGSSLPAGVTLNQPAPGQIQLNSVPPDTSQKSITYDFDVVAYNDDKQETSANIRVSITVISG